MITNIEVHILSSEIHCKGKADRKAISDFHSTLHDDLSMFILPYLTGKEMRLPNETQFIRTQSSLKYKDPWLLHCSWFPEDGGLSNHGSDNIWIHVRCGPSILEIT